MNQAHLIAFAQQAAAARASLFGATISYRGASYTASLSGIREELVNEDGGLRRAITCSARVPMTSGMNPDEGQILTITAAPQASVVGKVFRIAFVTTHPVNPEWKLDLEESVPGR